MIAIPEGATKVLSHDVYAGCKCVSPTNKLYTVVKCERHHVTLERVSDGRKFEFHAVQVVRDGGLFFRE